MWDRLRSSTLTSPAPPADEKPRIPSSRPSAGKQRPRLGRLYAVRRGRGAGRLEDLDDPFGALGLANRPYKYEIRRGKVVPQGSTADGPSTLSRRGTQANAARSSLSKRSHHRSRRRRQQRLRSQSRKRLSTSTRAQSITSETSSMAVQTQPPLPFEAVVRPKQPSPPPDMPVAVAPELSCAKEDLRARGDGPHTVQQALQRTGVEPSLTAHHALEHKSLADTLPRFGDASTDRGREAHPQIRPMDREGLPSQRPGSSGDGDKVLDHTSARSLKAPSHSAPSLGAGAATSESSPKPTPKSLSTSFGQRLRFIGRKPNPVETRAPWIASKRRDAEMQPPRDDMTVAPLNIPSKTSRQTDREERMSPTTAFWKPSHNSETTDAESSAALTAKFYGHATTPAQMTRQTTAALSPSSHLPTFMRWDSEAQSYPSPPASAGQCQSHSPRYHQAPLPMIPPASSPMNRAIKRKPTPTYHTTNVTANDAQLSSLTFSASASTANSAEPRPSETSQKLPKTADAWTQPTSRFSITTCATSDPGTPRLSIDDHPLPRTSEPHTSVMDRRRPIPGGRSDRAASLEPIVISMRSPHAKLERSSPLGNRTREGALRSPVSGNSSPGGAKPLPPAPPELMSAHNRVALLDAQVRGLSHRRANINKSIQQMTELMPTDNLLASDAVVRKREAEKIKVEALKTELADVQREEYDLGLKLHRAYKRLDKDMPYEPTTLWVRRMAS